MLEIFTSRKDPIFQGITIQQEFENIRTYYKSVLSKLYQYRADHTWWVDNKNILSRLLAKSIDPLGVDDISYFAYISSYADDFTRELEMSSKYNKGKWFFNNTYKGSSEAYYVTDDVTPIQDIGINWRKLRPLEVLYTNTDILDFSIPDTNNTNRRSFIFKINPIELFFQYKYWKLNRREEDSTSYNVYIGQYLLPRILSSYIDMCWINIINSKLEDKDFKVEMYSNLPFSVSDYCNKLDRLLDGFIYKFKHTKNSLDRIMLNIPCISNNNIYKTLKLPQAYYTKQVLWLPLLSRVDTIYGLLTLLGKEGMIANTSYTSGIKRYIRMLINSGNLFPHNTPAELIRNFNVKLFKIQQML